MKKLYLLAAAALCAATATAANGDVTDGWLMLEDFEGTAPALSTFKTDGSGVGTGTSEVVVYKSKDGNENNHVGKFTAKDARTDGFLLTVTLPAGKTIADYTAIKLDLVGINTSYKSLDLYIDGTKIYTQDGNPIGGQGSWNSHSHDITVTGGNTITIGFYNYLGNGNQVAFDNIQLKEKEGGSGEDPDPVDPTEPDATTNGTVTDGVLMVEDFQDKALGTECVWNMYGNAGKGTAAIAADPTKASNYVAEFTSTDYDYYVEVDVTLPDSKTLRDYKNIIFDFYRYTGDDNYKKMLVYADNEEIYLDGNYIEQGKEGQWTRNKKYAIPTTVAAGNSFKLRLGLNGTNAGHYAIDNIRLEEASEPVEPGTYDETKNGTVTDGWLMVEDFQDKQPGDDVTVKTYWGGEGKGSAKIEVDSENAKNLTGVFSVTDGDYNTIFALNITLPDGKTLKDYEKVAFDLYRFSDDDDYKQMLVMAGEEQIYLDVKDNGDANYVQQAPATTWTSKEYAIEAATTVGNTFTLYFGIKTNKGHYAVDNVRLREREPELEVVGTPVITIKHGTAAGTMTVSYSFEVANHNGEEIKVVASVDGHDEVIFEEAAAEPKNSPARAAGENKTFSGNLKAQHDVLKTISNPNVSLTATAGEKQLFAITKAPDTTTGIEDVTVDSEAPVEYFNLQGLRVAQPEAGQLYIKRQGDKAVKVRF